MAASSKPVIISCALTGSIHTPTMSDALPVTPDEIVEQGVGAAEAGAAIEFDWSRSAGLSLETTFDASVRPKFRLSANASVRVGVDLLFTDVSHTFGPWTRVLGEFGPDMELGVSFPVRWSEANGLDLSLDNMTVRQPTLDAPALMSSVFDQLVG